MKTLLTLLWLSLTLLTTAADFPPGSPDFALDLDVALKRAAKSGKPLVLIFSAGYCPPCQAMKKSVYNHPLVQRHHRDFEWAYIDVSTDTGAQAAQKFAVQPIPHIQFTTKDGKPYSNWLGYASPDQLTGVLTFVQKEITKKQ